MIPNYLRLANSARVGRALQWAVQLAYVAKHLGVSQANDSWCMTTPEIQSWKADKLPREPRQEVPTSVALLAGLEKSDTHHYKPVCPACLFAVLDV
jgi:hypothetical protein